MKFVLGIQNKLKQVLTKTVKILYAGLLTGGCF